MQTNHQRFTAALLATTLLVTACSSPDTESTPTAATERSDVDQNAASASEPPTDPPVTTPAEPALSSPDSTDGVSAPTEVAPTTAGAPTSSTTTSTTSTTTSTLPPTPEQLVIIETCRSVQNDGYETRKAALAAHPSNVGAAGGAPDLVGLRAACGADVDRLVAAIEVETRAAQMSADDSLERGELTCVFGGRGEVVVTLPVTNLADHPIGLHASITTRAETDGPILDRGSAPIVHWSLQPGSSTVLRGRTPQRGEPLGATTCNMSIELFDITSPDADASLSFATHPELTGDDPAVWFPALIEFEIESDATGRIDRAAVIEDLRSTAYQLVLDGIIEGPPSVGDASWYTVCDATFRGDDQVSIVYLVDLPERVLDGETLPAERRFRNGLFRRGADAQWRWLSLTQPLEGFRYDDCGSAAG